MIFYKTFLVSTFFIISFVINASHESYWQEQLFACQNDHNNFYNPTDIVAENYVHPLKQENYHCPITPTSPDTQFPNNYSDSYDNLPTFPFSTPTTPSTDDQLKLHAGSYFDAISPTTPSTPSTCRSKQSYTTNNPQRYLSGEEIKRRMDFINNNRIAPIAYAKQTVKQQRHSAYNSQSQVKQENDNKKIAALEKTVNTLQQHVTQLQNQMEEIKSQLALQTAATSVTKKSKSKNKK